MRETLHQYEERDSIEAKIVKDADNLDVDLELKEIEEMGLVNQPNGKKLNRRMVRDTKLYTESAKKIWDEIQNSDPSNWHRNMNKWITDPNAGK